MHRKIFLSILLSILLLSILSELPFSLKAGKQAQDSQLANGSVTIINEAEYTWYGDFIVNENETVVIENCDFTVVDGSIVDYGELQVLNSTIQIRKATARKRINVYGSFNLSCSQVLGTGDVLLLGNFAAISIYNSTLLSWSMIDSGEFFSGNEWTVVRIINSKIRLVYTGGPGAVSLCICGSEVWELQIDLPGSGNYYYLSCDISNSHIDTCWLQPSNLDVELQNLRRGNMENWTYSWSFEGNLVADLSITNSDVNNWYVDVANWQDICLSDCDAITLELDFLLSLPETVNLMLEPGFFQNKTIYQENALNVTLYNSTIDSWVCAILAGGAFQFVNSDCDISFENHEDASVTVSNSTIGFLLSGFINATLTIIDSKIDNLCLYYNKGSIDLVLNEGYQEFKNLYNEQQGSNVTILRTEVCYWHLRATRDADISIRNSNLSLPPPSLRLLQYRTLYALYSRGSARVHVYDSNIEAGTATVNSSLELINSTMGMLYAYDNANVTLVDSAVDTIIKDPPTITFINSQIRSDILLSFQMPDDSLSASMLDDLGTPLPPDIRRFGKYLQVDTAYDDLVDAQVRIYYNETEVSESGVDERGLRLYYLDESGVWQSCQRHGVNTEENFAWANVTKFSCFAVGFGSHHDLAVVDGSLMKTVVGQGFGNALNVTVINQGVFSENSNLTVYANATVIGTVETVAVEALDSLVMTFNWSTTDLARGNYAVTARVWPVTNESDIEDNSLALGNVYVGVPGDVNADGVVELMDFYAAGIAYLSTPEKPNWNPNADINNDGVVEMMDFFIMSQHYLEHT